MSTCTLSSCVRIHVTFFVCGDLGKLPVEDHKSTVCMISGFSAAFGKGNGPKKVILSHSTTPPPSTSPGSICFPLYCLLEDSHTICCASGCLSITFVLRLQMNKNCNKLPLRYNMPAFFPIILSFHPLLCSQDPDPLQRGCCSRPPILFPTLPLFYI
jgi:hypothetical protein